MIQIQYLGVTSRSWFYHICMKIIDGSCLHYNRLDRAVLIFSPKAGFDKMKIETIPPNKKKMSDMGTVICTISTGIEETSIEIPVSTHQFEKRHAYVDGNKITIKKLSPTFGDVSIGGYEIRKHHPELLDTHMTWSYMREFQEHH